MSWRSTSPHVVPKEEVEKYGADFGKHPVGTGAYKLTEWTLGQRIVFERNPDYWHKGLPYLDKITFEIGQEPIVALLRLQKGEIDVPGDGIPPAKFQEVMADPAQKARVVEGGQLHTGYITMNTTMAPFDNVKVRQAVNMAINKDRIVQLINNRAVPPTSRCRRRCLATTRTTRATPTTRQGQGAAGRTGRHDLMVSPPVVEGREAVRSSCPVPGRNRLPARRDHQLAQASRVADRPHRRRAPRDPGDP